MAQVKPVTLETIKSVEEEIKNLQKRKKEMLQAYDNQTRAARTHRLIERGVMLESIIGDAEQIPNNEISELLRKTLGSSVGVSIIASLKKKLNIKPAPPATSASGQGDGAASSAENSAAVSDVSAEHSASPSNAGDAAPSAEGENQKPAP